MANLKDSAYKFGQMDLFMLEHGRKVSNTEQEITLLTDPTAVKQNRVNGKMERD